MPSHSDLNVNHAPRNARASDAHGSRDAQELRPGANGGRRSGRVEFAISPRGGLWHRDCPVPPIAPGAPAAPAGGGEETSR